VARDRGGQAPVPGAGALTTFAHDTAVRPLGDGRFEGAIAEGWDIGGNANGGYLLALGARALVAASGRPDPVSLTAHYLAPGKVGPVTVETAIVKAGKRFSTATGTMRAADGRPVITMLGAFSSLDEPAGAPELVGAGPPELPDPDHCTWLPTDSGDPASSFRKMVDLRLHPEDAGFATGDPSGNPLVRGWFRLRDGEPLDPIALILAADAFPPTVFNARLPTAWTPTLELTCHVRGRPAPGWLRCVFSTRFVTGGFLEEDGLVWDATGRLVAQSRQLALVPRA
jgi:acyl-CoA thioesterase